MNTLQVSVDSPWLLHFGAATILHVHIAGGTIGVLIVGCPFRPSRRRR